MPRAWYNEIDLYCAEWLRNLIREGLIADGDVDTRSIADVTPNDINGYTQCHFFAGLGGWSGALRLAAWPDHRPVWTGSCPCQPFSLAGRQGGFADERHLWPYWHYLIAQCRPPTILGEQVASASQWLRLVRGDLEALDYAVGAIPVEAASAGADHLRDRYWFVGDHVDQRELQQEGPERAERGRLSNAGGMGHACCSRLAVGSIPEIERGNIWCEGAPAPAASNRGATVANANANGRTVWHEPGRSSGARGSSSGQHRDDSEGPLSDSASEQARSAGQSWQHSGLEWVRGADGKARRVKSGIRLLAHGIPARVAKLRAFGNAIDLRPAVSFIQAVM